MLGQVQGLRRAVVDGMFDLLVQAWIAGVPQSAKIFAGLVRRAVSRVDGDDSGYRPQPCTVTV
jgi:hypothetical protein